MSKLHCQNKISPGYTPPKTDNIVNKKLVSPHWPRMGRFGIVTFVFDALVINELAVKDCIQIIHPIHTETKGDPMYSTSSYCTFNSVPLLNMAFNTCSLSYPYPLCLAWNEKLFQLFLKYLLSVWKWNVLSFGCIM